MGYTKIERPVREVEPDLSKVMQNIQAFCEFFDTIGAIACPQSDAERSLPDKSFSSFFIDIS